MPIKTDNPLDVAVQGNGWLALQTPDGTVYTKDGRMHMDDCRRPPQRRRLSGARRRQCGILLDPNGGPPTIAQDGMISQKGRQIGAIGIFTLDDGAKLKRYNNSGVISDMPATPSSISPKWRGAGIHRGLQRQSGA